jgi:hypothetical protein
MSRSQQTELTGKHFLTNDVAPEVCRAMIDEMCRDADYYPAQPSPAP